MARDQELSVKITGDASDLQKAAGDASKSLTNLQKEVKAVDSTSIEISADLELDRINRDMANLNKALDGLERRKAHPDVDMDITQLLKDEAKIRKALAELDGRRIEITADVDTDVSGLARMTAALDDLDGSLGGAIPGLSSMIGKLKGVKAAAIPAAAAIAAIGIGIAGWKLGELAADVETTKLQLSALTGSAEDGAKAFQMLQQFAKDTPFELDEVTTAAKSLIAAGVDLKDIPNFLTDIGNVSSALGADLSEVALVFQQMLSKGKVSNEELLQLAERGVPVYQELSQILGVTVADVQKLASESKIGADVIPVLAERLGDLYPTAMQDQADSFNGKMSTLNDTIKQAGEELGKTTLPALSKVADVLQDLADIALIGAKAWTKYGDGLVDFIADLSMADEGLGNLAASIDAVAKGLPLLTGDRPVLGTVTSDVGAGAAALKDYFGVTKTTIELEEDHEQQMKDLAEAVETANDKFHDLKDAFTSFNDAVVEARTGVYDYQGALDDLTESLSKGTTFSPDLEQGRANWGALVQVAQSAGDIVANTFKTKGAAAATQVYNTQRTALHNLLTDAGVKSAAAWTLVDQVFKKPHQIQVELDRVAIAKMQARLARLRERKVELETQINIPDQGLGQAGRDVAAGLRAEIDEVDANIKATATNVEETRDKINGVANPKGKGRKAPIKAEVTNEASAKAILDSLTADRHANIFVNLIGGAAAGGALGALAAPRLGPQLAPQAAPLAGLQAVGQTMEASVTGTAFKQLPYYEPRSGTYQGTKVPPPREAPIRLGPKQVPVQVLLDGAEIATHIQGQVARIAAVTSVRRTA